MLIQFTVGNYLSIKEPMTLSMLASSITELVAENTFDFGRIRFLNSAAIYGANASGKSNIVSAMRFMKWMVFGFFKTSTIDTPIPVTRFKLSSEMDDQPALFEIQFIHRNIRYRYGFELDEAKIHSEWLFRSMAKREAKMFVRENDSIDLGNLFKEGKGLIDKTRSNVLFLSVTTQFNGEISGNIMDWFSSFNTISGLNDQEYGKFTRKKILDNDYKNKILNFLTIADLDIHDVDLVKERISKDEIPPDLKKIVDRTAFNTGEYAGVEVEQLFSIHNRFDKSKNIADRIRWDFNIFESEGTKKTLSLSGPFIDTLENGRILIIDELEARLHPLITRNLIRMFHSSVTNPHHAQLIFVTHDTSLLSNKMFRRDQIWFVEKNKIGASRLFSLVDYRWHKGKVRKDASYEKDYILGKYGAIPFIAEPDGIWNPNHENK
ncbi:MAG: ATP-binding protein [Candidatus Delongbacteria bacterium]|nr:ATP-binding protein [Candidatus Delongbacteria bacterium]